MKVFIGVGHGGKDPGAVAGGFYEKDLNLSVALACRDLLAQYGVQVQLSRTTDCNELLSDKISRCNRFAPDLALDIHHNAGGGDGAEVFHTYQGGTGKTLAVNILEAIGALGQNSRGAKVKKNAAGVDGYLFIRNTACPAVIVECAFLDHPKDVQIVDTPQKQQAMGRAIARGILKTLGIQEEKTLYRVQIGAFSQKANAENMRKKAVASGFSDAFIVQVQP